MAHTPEVQELVLEEIEDVVGDSVRERPEIIKVPCATVQIDPDSRGRQMDILSGRVGVGVGPSDPGYETTGLGTKWYQVWPRVSGSGWQDLAVWVSGRDQDPGFRVAVCPVHTL